MSRKTALDGTSVAFARSHSLSLRTKLLSCFGGLTLLLVAIGGVGVWGSGTQSSASKQQSELVPLLRLAMQAKYQTADFFGYQTAAAYEIATGVKGAADDKAANRSAFLASLAQFETQLHALATRALTPAEKTRVQQAGAALVTFKKLDAQGLSRFRANDGEKATKVFLYGEITPYAAIGTAMDAIVASLKARSNAAAKHSSSTGSLVAALMIGLVLAGALLCTIVGWLFARSLIRRVERVRNGAASVAAGDLTVEVVDHSGDEIGQVARAFGQMVENLRSLVGQASQVAGTLAEASKQMASTSEEAGRAVGEIAHAVSDVARGAEQQVQKLEVARVTTERMAASANESAEGARESAVRATEAAQLAHDGVDVVEQANVSMAALSDAAAEVADAVHNLGTKSEQIGGIVETITAIAAQTNLLALNAAIEAARAGEQGRGFAVVAEEVRKLAEESQQAAASIASLVAEIQTDTQRTVEKVELAGRLTQESTDRSATTRETFEKIGAAIEQVQASSDQIASAVQEIADGADENRQSMGDIASVAEQSSAGAEEVSASTQETSASTQEIAASAQQLAQTATALEQVVGQFKLA